MRKWIPRLREILRDAGALKCSEGVEAGGHFLIGIHGELFSVALDFSVVGLACPYMAIGSGRHHAYGALHALADLQLDPETRIRKALDAAAHFTCNVRPPYAFLSAESG